MRSAFLALALTVVFAAPARAANAAPQAPSLSAYAGHVVYLDFWASWCGPCGQAFPWLNQLQAEYGKDLVVVGVGVDTDDKAAERFLKQHPAQFDIVRDPTGTLAERFQIQGMPSGVILDRQGHVLHQHAGFRPDEIASYEAAVKAAVEHEGKKP